VINGVELYDDIKALHITACWSEHSMALGTLTKSEDRFGVELASRVRYSSDAIEADISTPRAGPTFVSMYKIRTILLLE
jgi:hypothetical protein